MLLSVTTAAEIAVVAVKAIAMFREAPLCWYSRSNFIRAKGVLFAARSEFRGRNVLF